MMRRCLTFSHMYPGGLLNLPGYSAYRIHMLLFLLLKSIIKFIQPSGIRIVTVLQKVRTHKTKQEHTGIRMDTGLLIRCSYVTVFYKTFGIFLFFYLKIDFEKNSNIRTWILFISVNPSAIGIHTCNAIK